VNPVNESVPTRYRISYGKGPAMRFTGHLDLLQTWERTFRRASLPLTYSQGFNPRPKLQLGPALPLGCTSECELVDIWLDPPLLTGEILTRLKDAAPPGIALASVEEVPSNDPALQNQVTSVEYFVALPSEKAGAEVERALSQLLDTNPIQRSRRGKTYNLRPLVEALELVPEGQGHAAGLVMTLASREGATGRPEEVLLELGLDPSEFRIHRTRLITG